MLNEATNLHPDIYFTEGYGNTACSTDEGNNWHSIRFNDGYWQLPLVIRQLPSGKKDAVSPYGYSGIYCKDDLTNKDELWSRTYNELRNMGIISVFLRQSPLVHTYTPRNSRVITDRHPTYFLESQNEAEAWKVMEGRSRTAIRKAIKNGITVSYRAAHATDLVSDSPFRVLYDNTMRRVAASSDYLFDDTYFKTLSDTLGGDLQIAIASHQGEPIAASLFLAGAAALHYHLSGSTDSASRLGATNLILWEAWRHASESGLPGLHLGGGLSEGDGLDRFKRSFGGRRQSYSTIGVVIDEDSYIEEVDTAARKAGVTTDSLARSGHFPAYRALL